MSSVKLKKGCKMTIKNIYKQIDNNINTIKRDLKEGRDLSAIIGSVGFNFNEDFEIALEYLKEKYNSK